MSSSTVYLYGKPPSATELLFAGGKAQPSASSTSSNTTKRPGMRRKSSASNLLNSFKGSTPVSATGSGHQTPTTAKDWDSQSLYSELSNVPTISSASSAPPLPPGTSSSADYLRELIRKRIGTVHYLKNILSGQSHWLSTVLITRSDLERTFPLTLRRQRTYRYAVLGMSLSNLFDIPGTQDFLRAILALLQEYDAMPEDSNNIKPKMARQRNFFKGAKLPKKTGGGDYGTYLDADASYLASIHIPFNLDYFQVCFALFDVLMEVYKRFATMLGPSYFAASNNIGPSGFGLVPPTPIVPQSSSTDALQSPVSVDSKENYFSSNPNLASGVGDRVSPLPTNSSLGVGGLMPAISIGTPITSQPSKGSSHHPGSPPPTWSPLYGDMLTKVDQKFMRIITSMLKKIDETARNRIREELASLSPLLQNLSPGNGVGYDHDPIPDRWVL